MGLVRRLSGLLSFEIGSFRSRASTPVCIGTLGLDRHRDRFQPPGDIFVVGILERIFSRGLF